MTNHRGEGDHPTGGEGGAPEPGTYMCQVPGSPPPPRMMVWSGAWGGGKPGECIGKFAPSGPNWSAAGGPGRGARAHEAQNGQPQGGPGEGLEPKRPKMVSHRGPGEGLETRSPKMTNHRGGAGTRAQEGEGLKPRRPKMINHRGGAGTRAQEGEGIKPRRPKMTNHRGGCGHSSPGGRGPQAQEAQNDQPQVGGRALKPRRARASSPRGPT